MTTERKIEIATAVMEDPRLGTLRTKHWSFSICYIIQDFELKDRESETIISELTQFMYEIMPSSTPTFGYWFTHKFPEARTHRIDFLQKYINHLKQQSHANN